MRKNDGIQLRSITRRAGGSLGTARASFLALALAVSSLTALHPAPAAAAPAEAPSGPQQILITYRSEAADRPAFRAYMQGEFKAQLEKLKKEGVLKGYQILFNPFTTTGTWDAMAVMNFSSFEATKRWAEIERTAPGGLSPAGLKLAKPTQTYSADLAWTGTAANPGPEGDRVVYVIPYSYNALDQYKKYVDAYVIPQVKGWMAEGVLSEYNLYLNRYPVGEPWDALFVYEYRDMKNFGLRESTVAKVREPLRNDPTWKQLNEIKGTIRSETENTVAEVLQ